MAKRFTDSRKWFDGWFLSLDLKGKLTWVYMLDACNHAGVYKLNPKLEELCLGHSLSPSEIRERFDGRVKQYGDKLFLPGFISFQYGKLNLVSGKNSNIHKSVALELETLEQGLSKGWLTLQVKDTVMDSTLTPIINTIVNKWNDKMPWKIEIISSSRRRSLETRVKDKVFVDKFDIIMDKILESDFASGRHPSATHPNFKCDFDWIIENDGNYVKVLEGKYDNRRPKRRGDIR